MRMMGINDHLPIRGRNKKATARLMAIMIKGELITAVLAESFTGIFPFKGVLEVMGDALFQKGLMRVENAVYKRFIMPIPRVSAFSLKSASL